MSEGGDAIAVWSQTDGSVSSIWVSRYSVVTNTWSTAVTLENDDTGDAKFPHIAIDDNGNALVVWQQVVISNAGQPDRTVNQNIYGSYFDASSNLWLPPQLLEDADFTAEIPRVAFDGLGNAIAVWRHFDSDSGSFSIYSNRFSNLTKTWGMRMKLDSEDGAANDPQIAADANGNAVTVWHQSDGTRDNIWSNRFDASTNSWGIPILLETDDAGWARSPVIAMDSNGNAMVLWMQIDGESSDIFGWSRRYDAASGNWLPQQLIDSIEPVSVGSHDVAFDASGNIILIWTRGNTTPYHLWGKRYVAE
jgi:hypothetical protein